MHVLVVDDDEAVGASLRRALRLEGFAVDVALSGTAALAAARTSSPDLIILDVLMPDPDGLEVCRRLRAEGDETPILMLTAREAIGDRVEGLEAGADDYVTKPFALAELLARIAALLRRTLIPRNEGLGADSGPGAETPPDDGAWLRFADLALYPEGHEAYRGARRVHLTRTEFLLLELLMRNPRQVLSRSLIIDRVWGPGVSTSTNSLEVFMSYLRRKTEAGGEPRLVYNVRGLGYTLRSP